ncbi:MAG: bifunctional DNA primase/polymerase [Chromatiaceae bacterium]|jgi:hypothetical protein|nr:bifunctional DNA primase/polymerase [Chromatiaceae bacterium]
MLKAALDYARLGWSVIPIEPRGERPLIRWQAYQYRRPEVTEVADWFQRWPDANLAVVTGLVSALVVLDLAPRPGADTGLPGSEQAHRALPETVESQTGAGGRHLYFTHPGEVLPNRVGIAPGTELHGDGGYVVAPPSLHASGGPYRWLRSPDVCPLAALPDWLIGGADRGHDYGHPPDHWRRLIRDGVPEGARSEGIAALARHLLRQGVDAELATELLLTWNTVRCRPPLEPEEVVGLVRSMLRRHPRADQDEG